MWGFSAYKPVENVQNRAIRYFLGVHRFAPTAAIVGETGWLPSVYRRWINMLWYWNRLLTLDDWRITKIAFQYDYIRSFDTNNWCSKILNIMTKLNITDHFYNLTPINIDTAKQRMNVHYSQLWSSDCEQSAKLRTYRTFKSQFVSESYLYLNLSRSERSLYVQFRCGILPLRIETGRYVGESPAQRLCVLCNTNVVEDECHFLVSCPKYSSLRNRVFEVIINSSSYIALSDNDKMLYLLRQYEKKVIKFITEAFCIRKNTIYR